MPGRFVPLLRQLTLTPGARRRSRRLKAEGRAARAAGRFAEAALLYEQALAIETPNPRLAIHCGHMRKEAGHLAEAEAHYRAAAARLPDDVELALQLGHFYKVAGRIGAAEAAYRRATMLRPGWPMPVQELAILKREGWRGAAVPAAGEPPYGSDAGEDAPDLAESFRFQRESLERPENRGWLVPKLAPRPPRALLHAHHEHVDVRRLGRREPGYWGMRRTLRGVEAIRGFCLSRTPIVELQIILNGITIHRGPVKGGYELVFEQDRASVHKYVFNVWLDFAGFTHGLHSIELRLRDVEDGVRSFHDHVVVAAPVDEALYPDSDALVSFDRTDPRSPEEQIRARPSMVRPAERALFPDGVRSVLVMRTDQLGDLVASIPAMRRLREIVPGARIAALLTGANAELARTLDLFDEVIAIDFPDDRWERRRLMPLAEQEALRARLEPYRFDIAIDLAQSNVSRDLLPLSGAKFLHGTGGEEWPWLAGNYIFNTPDRWNAMDMTPHSTKVLAMIECLGAILRQSPPVIRRDDLPRAMLEPFGLMVGERYAVLHAGARIEFSRWPHFPQLAQMLLAATDLRVVLMTEDPAFRATLPAALLDDPRLLLMEQRLSFDQFDAFISHAAVVVGNDSGPKHLASLRGTKVVTLFTARINWTEWGQEGVGSIISRRVPCAGCAIFHDAEECGAGWSCIRDIRPQEVLDAVRHYV